MSISKPNNLNNLIHFSGKILLGVDYGSKFIGLALYKVGIDPYPTPFGRIKNTDLNSVISELKRTLEDECVDQVILGLPLKADGTDSEMTKTIRRFKDEIEGHLNIKILFQDEHLTSFEAEDRMKNSPQYNFKVDLSKIDALAASIILEDFIKL